MSAAEGGRENDESSRTRHAIVTGASSGIGAAIAQCLLAHGWRVTGLDRQETPGGPKPDGYEFERIDLSDTGAIAALFSGYRAVDALVHAAGFMRVNPVGALNMQDGEAMWRVHVLAAEAMINAMAPGMPDGGRILLVGSRTAMGAAGRSQYAATKAALLGLTRSCALELASRGITVNVIAPGATETPMLHDPARQGTPPRLPPIGRFIQPREIAELAAYLLGPFGAAITGQQITICGGSSL
ncbi:SDR family NAD(P)-dependent oxidoreductase [Paralcaligenes ginsengisoli]